MFQNLLIEFQLMFSVDLDPASERMHIAAGADRTSITRLTKLRQTFDKRRILVT
jgi:hypothetical protein